MTSHTLYLRVGMLVIAGALLAVGFVLFLAGNRGGTTSVIYETYSRESVQGLDVGAPVRYRGVQIGRVTEIRLASAEYRPAAGISFTEAFRLVLVRFAVDPSQLGTVPTLEEAIRLGLRARITAQGITGVNYVELDFVEPERFPVIAIPWTPEYPVIPSIPSTVAQVRNAAEELVARLSSVPLEQMMGDLAQLLASLNQQTTEGDLATTLRESARAMTLLRDALDDGEIEATLADLRAAAGSARELLAAPELRATLASTAAAAEDIRQVAARLPAAMESLERTLRSARGTSADLQATVAPILSDLRATVANLRAATEQLRSSPSQLLFGAPPAADRRR
ncbi:MlaD family protein [Falsiroseomonas sp.]|uniref:MlaD family protein n=1 Tax=Falsiroseomonas sp. TaxID=2870721 RepID=UPI003568F378